MGCFSAEQLAIESTLRQSGPRYTGADVAALSQEWIDEDFSANDVEEWIDIGVWSPETAAALRDAGLSPVDVQAGACPSGDWSIRRGETCSRSFSSVRMTAER